MGQIASCVNAVIKRTISERPPTHNLPGQWTNSYHPSHFVFIFSLRLFGAVASVLGAGTVEQPHELTPPVVTPPVVIPPVETPPETVQAPATDVEPVSDRKLIHDTKL